MAESDNKKSDKKLNDFFFLAHSFERIVSITLYVVLCLIVIIALIRLAFGIYDMIFFNWDIKNTYSIQILFAMVMTVLIAVEFGNSILRHIKERSTAIQAREIILLGLMAVVRKIMLVDLSTVSPWLLGALGLVTISLASAYWFMQSELTN